MNGHEKVRSVLCEAMVSKFSAEWVKAWAPMPVSPVLGKPPACLRAALPPAVVRDRCRPDIADPVEPVGRRAEVEVAVPGPGVEVVRAGDAADLAGRIVAERLGQIVGGRGEVVDLRRQPRGIVVLIGRRSPARRRRSARGRRGASRAPWRNPAR